MNEWDTTLNLCIIIFIILIKKLLLHLHYITTTFIYWLNLLSPTQLQPPFYIKWIDAMLPAYEQCINYQQSIEIIAASSNVCLYPKVWLMRVFHCWVRKYSLLQFKLTLFYLYQYQNFSLNNFCNENKWRLNKTN